MFHCERGDYKTKAFYHMSSMLSPELFMGIIKADGGDAWSFM